MTEEAVLVSGSGREVIRVTRDASDVRRYDIAAEAAPVADGEPAGAFVLRGIELDPAALRGLAERLRSWLDRDLASWRDSPFEDAAELGLASGTRVGLRFVAHDPDLVRPGAGGCVVELTIERGFVEHRQRFIVDPSGLEQLEAGLRAITS